MRKALDYLREGDTLVVPSLDRLGRSIQGLIALVSGLRKRGIGFTSLHEALDTTPQGGRLVFHVFAAVAEFIRSEPVFEPPSVRVCPYAPPAGPLPDAPWKKLRAAVDPATSRSTS
ncbi:recombinase family protein [Streptomyces sp. NPDC001292]|uniref:recombinase family protein n=1 Tax=Streptomyces sp. NPDC001292 TaxID=3364558 RepID=UPI0036C498A5